jgi:hypothetical protein
MVRHESIFADISTEDITLLMFDEVSHRGIRPVVVVVPYDLKRASCLFLFTLYLRQHLNLIDKNTTTTKTEQQYARVRLNTQRIENRHEKC